ncbi:MAG: nitroreductase family protein [Ignavibacteria bacterium]|jgi:nitroreductase
MEFTEVVESRASVRKFSPDEINIEDVKEIIRLAGKSPSPNNSQPWKFLVIKNKEKINNIADIVSKKIDSLFPKDIDNVKATVERFSTFFTEAPILVAVLGTGYTALVDQILPGNEISHEELNAMRSYPDVQSIGAAVQTFLLSAVDKGLGACWLSGLLVAKKEIEEYLSVRKDYHLAACIAVGKPKGETQQNEKKDLQAIFEIIE